MLAYYIAHKGQHVHLGAIFADPYIIKLILGMGLADRLQRKKIIDGMAYLGINTHNLTGTVVCHGSRYVLTPAPLSTQLVGLRTRARSWTMSL